jgi:PAS domain S-box-containing protein
VPYSARTRSVARAFWIRRYWWLVVALVVPGGVATGWAVYIQAARYEHDRAAARFGRYVADLGSGIEGELWSVGEELHEITDFIALHPDFTAEEFRQYGRSALAEHPAIQACEWAPRVGLEEREDHEAQARARLFGDYRILALENGRLVPAGAKPEYYPVSYIEPLEPNRAALGFDLSSESSRREAIMEAARSGRVVLTRPLTVVQGPAGQRSFLAMIAVRARRPGLPHAEASTTPPGEVRGLVLFVIHARGLLGALSPQPPYSANLEFRLTDVTSGGSGMLIEASPGWKPGPGNRATWTREISAAGVRWALEARPTAAFLAERATVQPVTLGILAFLLFESLAGLLVSVAGRAHDVANRRQGQITQAVLDRLREGVVVADPDGRFLLFNGSAERILGLGLKHVSASEWSAVYGCYRSEALEPYPAEDLPLARALRGQVSDEEELFIRNPGVPDGVWISTNSAPITGDSGEPIGAVVTIRNVTRRKRTERELRASLGEMQQLKAAIDQAAIVSITDADGRILYCNDKFCEVSGYGRAELIGASHRLVNSAYHPASLFADMWRTIAGGHVWRGEVRNRAKSGAPFWVDMTIVPLFDGQARPERYLAICADITERVRQQETVRRLSSAIEQTADSVFITDRHGVIEYVNRGFEVTNGYLAGEVIGRTPRILKSGRYDEGYYRDLWTTILSGNVWRSTTINRTKTGREYHAEQTITPLKEPDGQVTHFVSVVKDVTERIKRQERELEMAYAARVQQRLYPQRPPEPGSFDIAGAVFPAAMTGGDYFDYLRMPGGTTGLAIGDVCGHGLGSAFIMAETRAFLRPLAENETDPARLLSRLNPLLYDDLQHDFHYVTLCLVRLDPANGRLFYASAGHPAGVVIGRDGEVKATLDATGYPLGLFEDSPYGASETLPLAPGDLLLLLTDGITEAESPDGSIFGMDGVLDIVRSHRHEPAADIVRELCSAACRFTGEGAERQDDLTVIVCKAL